MSEAMPEPGESHRTVVVVISSAIDRRRQVVRLLADGVQVATIPLRRARRRPTSPRR
jgi:hypothetical protein